MPNLQSWDVIVHGRTHRVELDRNPETGKHLVRVDGRVALKPFSESRGVDNRVKMLWLGSANDDRMAAETLRWAAGLNFFLVLTIVRGADYSGGLEAALRRLSAGEALSAVLPDIERTSQSRWRMTGRGESVFLAR